MPGQSGAVLDASGAGAERMRRDAPLRALHRPTPPPPAGLPTERGTALDETGPVRRAGEVLAAVAAVLLAIGVAAFVVRVANAERAIGDAVPITSLIADSSAVASPPVSAPAIALRSASDSQPIQFVSLPEDLSLAALVAGDHVPVTGGHTEVIRRHFGVHTVEAIVIVQCESNFVADAVGTNTNGTQDHGLFQINDVHRDAFPQATGRSWEERYDPEVNTAFAAWLFRRSDGWGPWTCSDRLAEYQDSL